MAKKILITGGAGFIGSHVVKMVLRETDWEVVNVDFLTYAGNLENLEEVEGNARYEFVQADIAEREVMREVFERGVDLVLHLAAETHVDNSISDASPFLRTNVVGTQVLLDLARKYDVEKFLMVSTDEVYGDWPVGSTEKFMEESPLRPSSPYSASKAGADLLCLAYWRTYGVPVVVSRCTNNYGTHQYPEKLIPFFVEKLLKGEKAPLYGDGGNVREWLAVEDHARALLFLLEKGEVGEVYNIGSGVERNNKQIFEEMCEILGKRAEESVEYVTDRLGHDRRYALDCEKLRRLGWEPREKFAEKFAETINWYKNKFIR